MNNYLEKKKILLIIGGGISAYKCLDLIRILKKRGAEIKAILTSNGQKFVTSLSVSSLTENKVFTSLFDESDGSKIDHLSLSRWSDVVLVAPATANLIAKFSHGIADDLASTLVLGSNKQIILAPAMNEKMWIHQATKSNIEKLNNYGYMLINPKSGKMVCGEYGEGKMADIKDINVYLQNYFSNRDIVKSKKLKAIVTAGPTREYIDPVRYITNESSGKQGYEIAKSLSNFGVNTTLISGPTNILKPANVKLVKVKSAEEMLIKTKEMLPVDIAVCAAAVCDFRSKKNYSEKIKTNNLDELNFSFKKNTNILEFLSKHNSLRPKLVVGFAAETNNVINFARKKLENKHCDWIIANNVSNPKIGFNSNYNEVSILYKNKKIEKINKANKSLIAEKISKRIINNFI